MVAGSTGAADLDRPAPPASPIQAFLQGLLKRLSEIDEGEVASYIPELLRADPGHFGIAIATVDGRVYSAGDTQVPFTIQSVSKPFLYGYALREYDKAFVHSHVGVEPTGEAFNSIILDDVHNRPFNPMVNAGAIAVAELMKGETRLEREQNMLSLMGQFAGRRVEIDEAVYRSESATGHRNRAIAYMMLNTQMIRRDPEDVLDLYFKQCSVNVTCDDLATMAATLANDGVNPRTGLSVLGPEHVRDVLTLMHSCGMYNYAGQWAYEVGLPAKSGVSGGIIAVIPGQLGLAIYSPRLDRHGNSVRGIKVCQEFSAAFNLHVFANQVSVSSVIRREYTAETVRSKRLRSEAERKVLAEHGRRIAAVELQGALYFGSLEKLMSRLDELSATADYMVVDFKRVHSIDASAARLVRPMIDAMINLDCHLAVTQLRDTKALEPLRRVLEASAEKGEIALYDDTDEALETFEGALLAQFPYGEDMARFSLARLNILAGLTPEDYRLLEREVQVFSFPPGTKLIRAGDPANIFFIIASGSVSVTIPMGNGRSHRVACIGPGLSVGEMALLDGGTRSADVVTDGQVLCYGFSVERIRAISEAHPNIIITILGNLTREMSERLRRANAEIGTLE